MNRNKPKYVSVRQDSFVFEAGGRRPRSDDSLGAKQGDHREADRNSAINNQIRINEISLFAKSNEETWSRRKNIYKLVELSTYMLCTLITLVSLLYSICTQFFMTKYRSLNAMYKSFNVTVDTAAADYFQYGSTVLTLNLPMFYFIIELMAMLIQLTDLLRVVRVFKLFRLETQLLTNQISLNKLTEPVSMDRLPDTSNRLSSYMQDKQDSNIVETINKLKIRCFIRNKFIQILNPLIKLNTLVCLYMLFFVFLPKYLIPILIQFTLPNTMSQLRGPLEEYLNATNSTATVQSIERDFNHYVKIIVLVLYSTASVNLLLKFVSLFNVKYSLVHRLLYKLKSGEDNLVQEYDETRRNLFRRNLQNTIEQSEDYWADNFMNLSKLNQEPYVNVNANESSNEYDNNVEEKTGYDDKTNVQPTDGRYMNVEMDNFLLGEEEKKAIELIDEATRSNNRSFNNNTTFSKKANTFKK